VDRRNERASSRKPGNRGERQAKNLEQGGRRRETKAGLATGKTLKVGEARDSDGRCDKTRSGRGREGAFDGGKRETWRRRKPRRGSGRRGG